MAEFKTSDYQEYTGSTASEIGYGSEVVNTHLAEYISPEGQRVGVAISQPVDGYHSTVIMPQTHDYRNEPLAIRRAEIMAHHLHARVALAETPGTIGLLYPDADTEQGYGVYTSHRRLSGGTQTPRQLLGALNGDFTDHSRVQLDAVSTTLSLRSSDELILFGESMGAATSTDMVKHIGERGLTLSALILHEAVNAHGNHGVPRLLSLLSSLGGIENDRRDDYFIENEVIGHPIRAFEQVSDEQKQLDTARKQLGQQGVASLANGIGMRKGINNRLVSNLSRFGADQPPVLLTRAADSTVSHAYEYEALSNQLRSTLPESAKQEYWQYYDEERIAIGHSFLVSLGRQAAYAQQLQQLVETTAS